jgi:hypothetical protein
MPYPRLRVRTESVKTFNTREFLYDVTASTCVFLNDLENLHGSCVGLRCAELGSELADCSGFSAWRCGRASAPALACETNLSRY